MKKYIVAFFLIFLISGCSNKAENDFESVDEYDEVVNEQLSYEESEIKDVITETYSTMAEVEDVSQVGYEKIESEVTGNIFLEMNDGLQNEVVKQLYEKEFSELRELSSSPAIVNVYEYDLNHDEINDKIVFLRSAIHSSTGGDTLQIWMSNGAEFEKVLDEIFYLMDMDNQFVAEAYIVDNYTDVSSIELMSDGKIWSILYDGMKYIRSEETESATASEENSTVKSENTEAYDEKLAAIFESIVGEYDDDKNLERMFIIEETDRNGASYLISTIGIYPIFDTDVYEFDEKEIHFYHTDNYEHSCVLYIYDNHMELYDEDYETGEDGELLGAATFSTRR